MHIFGSFTSLSSFLLLATFCLDQCHCLFSSASLSLVGDNLLVHERRVMATVELHLNETYDQHVALKSVNEKSQYKMRDKLFSSRTLFELAQGLWVSKKVNWIACMTHLSREALTNCQDRALHHFYEFYYYHQFYEAKPWHHKPLTSRIPVPLVSCYFQQKYI